MGYFTRKIDPFRPLLLALVAGCLAACSIDLPTPVVVQKDTTIAFPCQDRACGCKNADQCWASCCCFSDAEKLVWAEKNGVTLPDWFHAKMAISPKPVAEKESGCCCCQKEAASAERSECDEQSAATTTTVEVRLSFRQQKGCQGQTDYLVKHLVYVPLEIASDESEQEFPFYETPTASVPAIVLDLPTPPPRA